MSPKKSDNPLVTSITKTYYTISGKKYDRVTSVLDYFCPPDLVDWKVKGGKEAKATSKTAKTIGTRVHGLIKEEIEKGSYHLTPNDGPAVMNCMEAWKNWRSIEKPKVICTERTLCDKRLGVAGTFDMVTDKALIDIKTSDSIRGNYWIQLAMYCYMYGLNLANMAILRLDKLTGEYEYKVKPYDVYYVKLFKGLLNYYRYCQKPEPREIEEIEVLENPFERSVI